MTQELIRDGHKITRRVKKIWDTELNMARRFIEICDKYGLTYYAFAGTLLGAVRHKGFIPWDSDMDFAMKRADFDKFCEVAKEEITEPYFFQCDETDDGIFLGAKARIRDSRTTGVEVADLKRRSNWGIWIDILCLDYLREDEAGMAAQLSTLEWYRRILMQSMYGENVPECQQYSFKQKMIYKYYAGKLSRKEILDGYKKGCMMGDGDGCTHRFLCRFTKDTKLANIKGFFAADFDGTVVLEFEDMHIKAPKGYERVLKMYYGNYEAYIPEQARNRRDGTIIDPYTPYTTYQHRLMDMFADCDGKIIVLFGAGNMVNSYMAEHGVAHKPSFIVDNGENKWGRIFGGVLVYPPEKLLTIPKDKLRVIICNIYYPEISKQLEKMGIDDYYLYAEDLRVLDQTILPDRVLSTDDFENTGDNSDEKAGMIIDFHGGGIGKKINAADGILVPSDDTTMTTFKVFPVNAGDVVEVTNVDYEFKLATYSGQIDGTLIYTYCYQPEENWTTYNHDFREEGPYQQIFVANDSRFIRVQVRRIDGGAIPKEAETEGIIRIRSGKDSDSEKTHSLVSREVFAKEVEDTAASVISEKEANAKDSISMALLTDTHYAMGGTWEDTAANLLAVHDKAHFDAVVHLGDLIDGISTRELAQDFANIILDDIGRLGTDIYMVIGNHDTNYFKGNPEVLSRDEQAAMYFKRIPKDIDASKPWYYKDVPGIGLRMIFLSSYNPREKVRYGFDDDEVVWFQGLLCDTPKEMKVIVFSHVPLLPKMHYWSDEIRNHEKVLALLQDYNQNKNTVLGYIHGHSHCDQINTECGFPIVSVGCNKVEYFHEYKPEGSITYQREIGKVSQDLWDGLIITPSKNRLAFIRFGAGEDRIIENNRILG